MYISIICSVNDAKQFQMLIPEQLHRRFKAKCALQGHDMSEVLMRFIQSFVEDKKQPRK